MTTAIIGTLISLLIFRFLFVVIFSWWYNSIAKFLWRQTLWSKQKFLWLTRCFYNDTEMIGWNDSVSQQAQPTLFLKHINQTTHNIQAASTCGENITFKIISVYRVIFSCVLRRFFFCPSTLENIFIPSWTCSEMEYIKWILFLIYTVWIHPVLTLPTEYKNEWGKNKAGKYFPAYSILISLSSHHIMVHRFPWVIP